MMTAGRGHPDERLGFAIPGGKPFVDGGFQFAGIVKGSATNHSPCDQGVEPFHLT